LALYRSQIADLKRRAQVLEREVKRFQRAAGKDAPSREALDPANLRFSAKGFAKNRQRLGLSQKECGMLIGASALSVYKWERGEVRPRARYLETIARSARWARRRLLRA
jgi:DNA-binding transcriptional regulator YiaG